MIDQNTKRPDACVLTLLGAIFLAFLSGMGFTALEMPAGLLMMIAGSLGAWKVLRWAQSRNNSNGGPPSLA